MTDQLEPWQERILLAVFGEPFKGVEFTLRKDAQQKGFCYLREAIRAVADGAAGSEFTPDEVERAKALGAEWDDLDARANALRAST